MAIFTSRCLVGMSCSPCHDLFFVFKSVVKWSIQSRADWTEFVNSMPRFACLALPTAWLIKRVDVRQGDRYAGGHEPQDANEVLPESAVPRFCREF